MGYRAIAIRNDEGSVMCIMNIHNSVSDEDIKDVFHQYTLEVESRHMQNQIKNLKAKRNGGTAKPVSLNVMHRLNILKKIVRLNPRTNGFVDHQVFVVHGRVSDLKNAQEMDRGKLDSQIYKDLYTLDRMDDGGRDEYRRTRMVETQDEYRIYRERGQLRSIEGMLEKVYFVEVRGKGVTEINLFNDQEMMTGEYVSPVNVSGEEI